MYKEKLYKVFGVSLALISFICLALLTFSYRDLSVQLVLMFLFTLSGLPMSAYLLIKRKTYLLNFSSEDDDVMDVVGKFSLH